MIKQIGSLIVVSFCLLINTSYAVNLSGKPAPEFNLKSVDNKQVSLAQLSKKGHVLVVFWAPECVYCMSHVSELNKLQKEYVKKLTIVAINFAGERVGEVKEYIQSYQPKYLFLADRLKNIDVAHAYKVVGSPTFVLISPNGKILSYGHKIPQLSKWIK